MLRSLVGSEMCIRDRLLDYRVKELEDQGINDSLKAVKDSIQSKCTSVLDENWMFKESIELRTAIGDAAGGNKGWFKRIDHGEFAGGVCLEREEISKSTALSQIFEKLSKWIEND